MCILTFFNYFLPLFGMNKPQHDSCSILIDLSLVIVINCILVKKYASVYFRLKTICVLNSQIPLTLHEISFSKTIVFLRQFKTRLLYFLLKLRSLYEEIPWQVTRYWFININIELVSRAKIMYRVYKVIGLQQLRNLKIPISF